MAEVSEDVIQDASTVSSEEDQSLTESEPDLAVTQSEADMAAMSAEVVQDMCNLNNEDDQPITLSGPLITHYREYLSKLIPNQLVRNKISCFKLFENKLHLPTRKLKEPEAFSSERKRAPLTKVKQFRLTEVVKKA